MLNIDLLITSPVLRIVKAITILSNLATFILHVMKSEPVIMAISLFGWLVADGWC
jgi:hypothetical protein